MYRKYFSMLESIKKILIFLFKQFIYHLPLKRKRERQSNMIITFIKLQYFILSI